jgi:hypothetical protein
VRAVAIDGWGGREQLGLRDLPEPKIGGKLVVEIG